MTLTVPHSGSAAQDMQTLPLAWRELRKHIWRFFKHEHGLTRDLLALVAFVRVVEVTPGEREDGHAHLHVYLLSPYVPEELVRHLWGQAIADAGYHVPTREVCEVLSNVQSRFRRAQLERVLVTRRGSRGRLLDRIYWPVVQIKECYGDVERELVKYLVKDAELEHGKLNLIEPELYARIYEGLEGVRTVATSRHFFVPDDRVCRCEQCGSGRLSTRVVKKAEPDGSAEGSGDD